MNESMCNVMLTNWKRLSNAPIDLSKCFAVQWRQEFIVVSDSDGSILLYNVKWNMWSQLAELPDDKKPCQGCPLTCYDEKLLILAQEGKMYELMPEINQWRENQTFTSDQFDRRLDTAVLTSSTGNASETMLFVIYRLSSYNASSHLQFFDGSSWSEPVPLQLNVLVKRLEQKHISIAIQKMTIYINNEDTIYHIHVPTYEGASIMQPEEVAQAQDTPNGESKAVAQNMPASLPPMDVVPRKHRNEDHNLNLGTVVKIPKLDTDSIECGNN